MRTTELKGESVQSPEGKRYAEEMRGQVKGAGLSLKCRECSSRAVRVGVTREDLYLEKMTLVALGRK